MRFRGQVNYRQKMGGKKQNEFSLDEAFCPVSVSMQAEEFGALEHVLFYHSFFCRPVSTASGTARFPT